MLCQNAAIAIRVAWKQSRGSWLLSRRQKVFWDYTKRVYLTYQGK